MKRNDNDTELAEQIEGINKFAEKRIKDKQDGDIGVSDYHRIEMYRLHQIRNACADYPCHEGFTLRPLEGSREFIAKDSCFLCGSESGRPQFCSRIREVKQEHFVCERCTQRINPGLNHKRAELDDENERDPAEMSERYYSDLLQTRTEKKVDSGLTVSEHKELADQIRRAETLMNEIYFTIQRAYFYVDSPTAEDKQFIESVEKIGNIGNSLSTTSKTLDQVAKTEHVWLPIYDCNTSPPF